MGSQLMKISRTVRLAAVVSACALVTLSGCKQEAPSSDQASAQPGNATLASVVSGAKDLSIVSTAMKDAGLSQVFDGAASYTILAPQDAAFEKLGSVAAELQKPEQRPAMVAILRDHIVPGYLTPQDLGQAIDRAAGNGVKMRTMGDRLITFTRDGAAIVATQDDGSTARLGAEALLAGNGVAIPVDGVLKKVG
jgi:uncharacterized surface protein with fasciclin (FAS1) repeats